MTGPQQSRPSPAPRGGDDPAGARPSPRPRHERADDEFPDNSYQGEGYPDLRASRPVERPAPPSAGGYEQDSHGGTGPQPVTDVPAEHGAPARSEQDEPTGYAAPVRYAGYGAPVQAGTAQDTDATTGDGRGLGAPAYDETAGYGMPGGGYTEARERAEEPGDTGAGRYPEPDRYADYGRYPEPGPYTGSGGHDPAGAPDRQAYGEYGGPASRGGTAIDGGPPYPAAPAARSGSVPVGYAGSAPAGHGAPEPAGGTAVAELTDDAEAATGPTAVVPAPRDAAEGGRRPTTVAEAAAARFGASGTAPSGSGALGPDGAGGATAVAASPTATGRAAAPRNEAQHPTAGPAATVAKDPTAVTVLRVLTYVLVSLSCLVFLAGVVYGVVVWLELRETLGTSPLFGGGPTLGG